MLPLFAATIFLGAFLLFLVQPLVARALLPSLGGSPAVWNTCMVFFQAALLAGYAYAHLLGRRLTPRMLAPIHAVAVLGPLVLLGRWASGTALTAPAGDASPVAWLLGALATTVGLPFVIVSTGAPLLQHWLSRSGHRAARDPYFLYAASNAGSLLALLAYPALVEPLATLDRQRHLWTAGYAAFAVLTIACAAVAFRTARAPLPDAPGDGGTRTAPQKKPAPGPEPVESPWRRRLLWLAASAVPSSLMLGTTQYLSTDVAAVPLMWVIPLALYLLTFIIAFSGRPVPVASISRFLSILIVGLTVAVIVEAKRPIWILFVLHSITFFLAALLCHSRLAASRPSPRRLTEFYLLLAAGGVLGGLFNALLAPVVFDSIAEYPLALTAACLFRTGLPPAFRHPWPRWVEHALDVGGPLTIFMLAWWLHEINTYLNVAIGVPALLAYLCTRRPARFALAIGALFWLAHLRSGPVGLTLHAERTFFGVCRVLRDQRSTVLVHGTTTHGEQFRDPSRAGTPLGYYHPEGPIGDVFRAFGDRLDRVGLVGLGTGSLAAYGRPGQRLTFYEIDPAVVRIASNPDWFTYLRDSRATIDFVLGDGRLSLRDRAGEGEFALVVIDAFTSDAIPVHLLTREAVELYVSRLRPGGLLALHVSNQYLELTPVAARIAATLELAAVERNDTRIERQQALETGRMSSHWLVLARTEADIAPLLADPEWRSLTPDPRAPLWTDDYSNILGVIDWE